MADIIPITIPSKVLAASMTSATLTLKLNNIEGWDGDNVVAGDLGTVMYAVLRNSSNTLMEIIEVDPTTIANALTTGMTINKRGLQFDGNITTQVVVNKLTWVANATTVELGTNAPQLLNHFVKTIGSPTIDELLQYTTELTPTDNKHIATKKYVDDTAFGGTITIDQLIVAATAGETVAAGELVYLNETDGEWYLTDANTVATIESIKLGIAQGAGTNGVAITGGVLVKGLDKSQSGMTIGESMYASDTPGAIANSAGSNEKVIGVARTATELYFDPEYKYQVTDAEKSALAGISNTPSATNKFVTEDDLSDDTILPPEVVPFTASGTWTKDANLKYILVEVVGGGGGGDSADTSSNNYLIGDGGGAGGYSRKLILASALGATETVTVGAGGAAGLDGEDTTFGAHLTGGKGFDNMIGGAGSGGDVDVEGGNGSSGESSPQGNLIGPAGAGGASYFGGGGGAVPNEGNGQAGQAYGSGGSGAFSNDLGFIGGAGADGIVIVTEYYS